MVEILKNFYKNIIKNCTYTWKNFSIVCSNYMVFSVFTFYKI